MLDGSELPGTPEWWLLRLGRQLSHEQARFDRLESYWAGDPPLPFGNQRMREAYRRLQRMSRTNFGLLLVESVVERLVVMGFRASGDASGATDDAAWIQWQANRLDADSTLVHRAALIMSRSYVIVGDDPDKPGTPLVTAEDPRQVIHESSPTNRRDVIAAMKTWRDDVAQRQLAVVYLPDTVHYFASRPQIGEQSTWDEVWQADGWDIDTSEFPMGVARNPFGVVPVVPFVNRPCIDGSGIGEFEDVVDILDRINTSILDRCVISAMQAYRQRYATGVSLLDENGNPTGEFDPGADMIWVVEDENAKFGDFEAANLIPIIKAIESDVSYLGAVSRTPPSYLLAAIVNASGDALAAAEVGLVSKCLERTVEFGNSWENVYRLMSQISGNKVGDDAVVLWKDPQFRSLGELAAAAVQLATAGVPWETRMVILNYSPTEIERMKAQREEDNQLMVKQALALAPPDPTSPNGASPGANASDPSKPAYRRGNYNKAHSIKRGKTGSSGLQGAS